MEHISCRQQIDPFHLYLRMVEELGEGRAFLLDAAQDAGSPEYRMSLVAAVPLLEVQVKNHNISLHVTGGLRNYMSAALLKAGYHPTLLSASTQMVSVIPDAPLLFAEADPLQFLETLRLSIRNLRSEATSVPFSAGLLGYIGYDAVHYLETLPTTTRDDRNLPDIRLQWFGAMVQLADGSPQVFDVRDMIKQVFSEEEFTRYERDLNLVQETLVTPRTDRTEARLNSLRGKNVHEELLDDVSQAQFEESVEKARAYIRAGDIFQVVLSKRMRIPKRKHHYAIYDELRKLNPSPYMFMAEYPDMRLFGASPEVQFRVVHGIAEMKPIAGTSKGRGASSAEDERLKQALLSDEKERAEHVMLVDLCRNDVGKISETGTVCVTQFMAVEPYSHLFHLVSRVEGKLRNDISVFHALVTTFPAGTLSGAPKIRAMEIIDELEAFHRGPYGGLVGMIDFDGNANTAIVIRTVVECRDTYFVQVGAGIVADSQATQEWMECGHKARAVLTVLGVHEDAMAIQ